MKKPPKAKKCPLGLTKCDCKAVKTMAKIIADNSPVEARKCLCDGLPCTLKSCDCVVHGHATPFDPPKPCPSCGFSEDHCQCHNPPKPKDFRPLNCPNVLLTCGTCGLTVDHVPSKHEPLHDLRDGNFGEAIKITTEAVEEQVKNLPEDPPKHFDYHTDQGTAVKHIHVTEPVPDDKCPHPSIAWYEAAIGFLLGVLVVSWSIQIWQWHHWSSLWDQQKVVYMETPVPDASMVMQVDAKYWEDLWNDCHDYALEEQSTIKYLRAWKRDHE